MVLKIKKSLRRSRRASKTKAVAPECDTDKDSLMTRRISGLHLESVNEDEGSPPVVDESKEYRKGPSFDLILDKKMIDAIDTDTTTSDLTQQSSAVHGINSFSPRQMLQIRDIVDHVLIAKTPPEQDKAESKSTSKPSGAAEGGIEHAWKRDAKPGGETSTKKKTSRESREDGGDIEEMRQIVTEDPEGGKDTSHTTDINSTTNTTSSHESTLERKISDVAARSTASKKSLKESSLAEGKSQASSSEEKVAGRALQSKTPLKEALLQRAKSEPASFQLHACARVEGEHEHPLAVLPGTFSKQVSDPTTIGIKEVDYDTTHVTDLYKYVEQRNWEKVIETTTTDPYQAQIWVYRWDKNDRTKIRWKVLPIHAAIVFKCPPSILKSLIEAYPQGCEMKDDRGCLPVHLAYKRNLSEECCSMLLKAYPDGMHIKDNTGCTPTDFLQVSCGCFG